MQETTSNKYKNIFQWINGQAINTRHNSTQKFSISKLFTSKLLRSKPKEKIQAKHTIKPVNNTIGIFPKPKHKPKFSKTRLRVGDSLTQHTLKGYTRAPFVSRCYLYATKQSHWCTILEEKRHK